MDDMKTPKSKRWIVHVLPAVLILVFVWNVHSGQNSLRQRIENAKTPFDDQKRVDTVVVNPMKTVLVKTKYQGGLFRAETRKDKMERFQCSQCHNRKAVTVEKAAQIAHSDIALIHGGEQKPLSCYTCHNKDERNFLVTEKGLKVDMDHSYQLCGQCHFRQKKDWVGGAHGKRVSFWAGERIVKNCTSCHDPHSPRFQKQWPRTYSRPLGK